MTTIGGNQLAKAQNERGMAQVAIAREFGLVKTRDACDAKISKMRENRMSARDAYWRLQSLNRRVPLWAHPVFRILGCAEKCRNGSRGLAVAARKAHGYGIVFNKKGTRICLTNPGSSQQLHHFLSRVASRLTSSAVSLARLQALPQPKFWALTRSPLALPALPLACCVTTPASAAHHAKLFAALSGQIIDQIRRRGFSSAAFLRSKDHAHV